jgi:small nuclear ribonucleoprotein (snRNP)-like protein
MKRVLIGAVLTLCVLPLLAQVSDTTWDALVDREVLIIKQDGSEVTGTLIGVDVLEVNVMKEDGRIVVVDKAEVEEVRGVQKQPAEGVKDTAENIPPGNTFFLFNPLGFLQAGPIFEYGFLVGDELYVAPRFRILGLGLLPQVFADFTMNVYSSSVGINIIGQAPAGGKNRWYYGGAVEFGLSWEKGTDNSGDWEGSTGLIILGSNFGYKWRSPSGSFTNLGFFGGAAFELWNEWWYSYAPSYVFENDTSIYFVGGIELSFGWEGD